MMAGQDDVALRVQQKEVRDTLDREFGANDTFQIEDLVVIDAQFFHGVQGGYGFVLNRDADDF